MTTAITLHLLRLPQQLPNQLSLPYAKIHYTNNNSILGNPFPQKSLLGGGLTRSLTTAFKHALLPSTPVCKYIAGYVYST